MDSGGDMPHTFVCELHGDPAAKIEILKRKAGERGIRFIGDTTSGQFSGWGLNGFYQVQGMQVVVTIDSLPLFYTYQRAEGQIRSFLQG